MKDIKGKLPIILLFVAAFGISVFGIVLLNRNAYISKQKIEILDATYNCQEALEKFYEDDKYIYYFPCIKSKSVYVKLVDGNKMLVTKALEEGKVTINELIKAGLEVHKDNK